MRRILSLLFITLLVVSLSISLDFTISPTITPQLAFTDEDIACDWTVSGDTTAVNVTWYQEGSQYSNTYDNSSPYIDNSTVLSSATTKNEDWTCLVQIFNSTTDISENDAITIQNSAPETPTMYDELSQNIGTYITVTEDQEQILDINSSDNDLDTLTYYLKVAKFCTVTNSGTGATSCTPVHSYIKSGDETEYVTEVNITFWVDDDDPIFAKSASKTITFNITPVNDKPSATVTDQISAVNSSLNYTFTASDEEEDYPLNFTVSSDAEVQDKISVNKLNADGTSISFYYDASSVDYNDVGIHTITINVTDNRGENQLFNFTLNLTAIGRPPYFVDITPSSPYVAQQGDFIQINISANDPDANATITFIEDTNRFAIFTINSETNVSNATAQINFTPSNDDVGNYNVTLQIQDNEGLTNTTILTFNISNVNDVPIIYEMSYSGANTHSNINITNLTGYANSPFVYDVNGTDIDIGDVLTFFDNTSLFDIN
ncbi:hypothetical protein GOV11_04375, partial [Candidatus Woesearchaeota archaeon]|nr:hypothetical protein [Candidatus Woesearchaeota archaeon]